MSLTLFVDPKLAAFGAVMRENQASRERERREYWSVQEWRLFLGAAIACGLRYPSLRALLKRGASAEEIALEFGQDKALGRIRERDRVEREAREARRSQPVKAMSRTATVEAAVDDAPFVFG